MQHDFSYIRTDCTFVRPCPFPELRMAFLRAVVVRTLVYVVGYHLHMDGNKYPMYPTLRISRQLDMGACGRYYTLGYVCPSLGIVCILDTEV